MAFDDDVDLQPLPLPPLLPRAERTPSQRLPLTLRLLDGLTQSLPVVVMALLAIATTWLVRQTPSGETDQAKAPMRHVPDYEMQAFSLQRHPAGGLPASVIEGRSARHYPDTDTLEIDDIHVRWVDPKGQVTLIQAAKAILEDNRSHAVLEGHAVVTRLPLRPSDEPMVFSGERLLFDNDTQQIHSQQPVQWRQGTRVFDAGGLQYDHRSGDLSLHGRVRGVLPAVQR